MFSQDFQVDAIEKFISEASIPIVTIFNKDPSNYDYVNKFFDSSNDKVLSFVFPFPLFVCIYIFMLFLCHGMYVKISIFISIFLSSSTNVGILILHNY